MPVTVDTASDPKRLSQRLGLSPRLGLSERLGLTERQELVLRAIVAAHVGEAAPVGSSTLSHLLPVPLSAASIRNTMVELAGLGLIEKPHRSAGRVPTARGLRCFVDGLDPAPLDRFEARDLSGTVDATSSEKLMLSASRLLSERTRQLGFVVAPRIDSLVLQHVTLVRLSSERVLALLVTADGTTLRCRIDDDACGDQSELDRAAAALNERIGGRSLGELRDALELEAGALRSRARSLVERAAWLGWRALEAAGTHEPGDLVIASRLALLDQPEFHDPGRVRQLFGALEAKEGLLEILDKMLESNGVQVTFGDEIGEPELRQLAVVIAPYGKRDAPVGVLGVIGPKRMDYPRILALVEFFSEMVTEKMS